MDTSTKVNKNALLMNNCNTENVNNALNIIQNTLSHFYTVINY